MIWVRTENIHTNKGFRVLQWFLSNIYASIQSVLCQIPLMLYAENVIEGLITLKPCKDRTFSFGNMHKTFKILQPIMGVLHDNLFNPHLGHRIGTN